MYTYFTIVWPPLSLHYGVAGAGSNATVVVMVAAHHDVALHAPIAAPAVLHQPVCFSTVSIP